MATLHRLAEFHRFGAILVLFASNRDVLVDAAPEYQQHIDDEIDIAERRRPCWLAVDDDFDSLPEVGNELRPGAPRWFAALTVVPL